MFIYCRNVLSETRVEAVFLLLVFRRNEPGKHLDFIRIFTIHTKPRVLDWKLLFFRILIIYPHQYYLWAHALHGSSYPVKPLLAKGIKAAGFGYRLLFSSHRS